MIFRRLILGALPIARFALISVAFVFVSSAFAQFGVGPTYNPPNSIIQGNQPLVAGSVVLAGSDPFTVTITKPVATGLTYPRTVRYGVRIPSNVAGNPGVPLGGDTNAALGYCKFRVGTNPDGSPILSSTVDVLFTAASLTAQVTVYVNVPSPVVSGNYYWNIYGTDWPTGTTPAINDAGHTINATVLPPIVNPTVKPVIVNLLPTNGTNYTYDAPTPVAVAISFTANCNATTAQGGATIEQLAASFDTTSLSVTPTGLLSTNPDGTFTASGTVTHYITDAGPHTIKVSATNTAGTTFATTQINILAPPTITSADHTTFVYGDAGSYAVTVTGYPAPTFAATGLPSWASIDSTTGVISGTPGAAAGSVFTFTITATNSVTTPNNSTGTSTQTFTLNVVPRPLTVKATAATKVYGSADPSSFDYSVTSGSFVGTDTFSGALVRDAGESVGSYKINQGTLTAGSNYSITYVDANFTITTKALTVTATAADKIYDGSTAATFTAAGSPQLIGKVGSDDVALGSGVTASFADKNVGTNKDVTLSGLSLTGTTAGNYTLTAPGVLKASITPATLVVKADSFTRVYGSANPTLTVSYSGLVLGDTVVTPATASTGATITSDCGAYDITAAGASAPNYVVSYQKGTLTITQATPTIVWPTPASIDVNTPLSSTQLNATATGVFGETVSGTFAYSPASGTLLAVGTQALNTAFTPTGNFAVNYKTATKSNSILVTTAAASVAISGRVFFDVNANGVLDSTGGDFGLSAVRVELRNSSNVLVQFTPTDNAGNYSFTVPAAGSASTYYLTVVVPTGMTPSSSSELTLSVSSSAISGLSTGLSLNFDALRTMSACGYTIGYWKNNLSKAYSLKSTGTQETVQSLCTDTNSIRGYALPLFSDLSACTPSTTSSITLQGLNQAAAIMGSTLSDPVSLLKKQLLASEYNYAGGAYLNGNASLTGLFIHWGEVVATNPSAYSSTYITWAKDWFDAYNNSHCGLVAGPAPLGSTSIASNFNGTAIPGGSYLWLNAVINVTGRNGKNAVITSSRSNVQFTVAGTPVYVDVPEAVITFDSTATVATTTYDDASDTWRTTVPASYTGNVFYTGIAVKLPFGLPGGINPVTWNTRFTSTVSGLSASWQWAAAAYAVMNDVDPDLLGVKAIEGSTMNLWANSDHSGTPELFKTFVIGGARGGGGSNYTGSYSATASLSIPLP